MCYVAGLLGKCYRDNVGVIRRLAACGIDTRSRNREYGRRFTRSFWAGFEEPTISIILGL